MLSIGTNTVRLLVARTRPDGSLAPERHEQTGTRLGAGLREGGTLDPAGVERTLAAAERFAAIAREERAELVAIATSAVRRAADGPAFARCIAGRAGVSLRIIGGDLEAEASFRGAVAGAPCDGTRLAVIDVGGGSTECAVGRAHVFERARSIELGSVTLGERYPDLLGQAPGERAREAARRARAFAAQCLAPNRDLAPVDAVRAVAGTPATIAAVVAGSHVDRVSGTLLSRATLDATVERLLDIDLAERRALPGMLAQRADIVVAGAIILSEALDLLGAGEARVEANDLLLGYLMMTEAAATSDKTDGRGAGATPRSNRSA